MDYSETNLTQIFVDMILTQSMPFFDIGLDIAKNNNYQFQVMYNWISSNSIKIKYNISNWEVYRCNNHLIIWVIEQMDTNKFHS